MPDPIVPGVRGVSGTPAPTKAAAPAPAAARVAMASIGHETLTPGTVEQPSKPGTFSYTTTIKINAKPEAVLQALQGDWNAWWKGGLQTNLKSDPTGASSFDLAPVHTFIGDPIKVHVQTAPPEAAPLDDGKPGFKVVIPVQLSGNFNGHAHFTIIQADDGNTYLQSTWKDVEPAGTAKAMGHGAMTAHFAAENNALANMDRMLNHKAMKGLAGLL